MLIISIYFFACNEFDPFLKRIITDDENGWEVILYPPYSPDLPPSDYYLFRSLQNSLNGKTFNDDKALKSHLVQFLLIKSRSSMSVEAWSYQKDCKRSLNKMWNISLIKVYNFYFENFFWILFCFLSIDA